MTETRVTAPRRGMAGLKKRRRVQVILLAAAALLIASAVIGYGLRDGINLFRSPSELLAAPPGPEEVFRIGGLVEEGSLVQGQGTEITFRVTDGGATVDVSYEGIRPDLFGEGQGVVAMGRWTGSRFEATEILAKHDESYMPKEVMDALKEQGVYVAPE